MSTETKHTPGPWQIDEDWNELKGNDGQQSIAELRLYEFDDFPCAPEDDAEAESRKHAAEATANGRLIIAAPDLLSALTCIMHWVDRTNVTNPDAQPAIDAAHAAIAKATRAQAT